MQKRDKLIQLVEEALENGNPLIIMAKGNDDTALALQGSGPDLSFMAVEAFMQERKFLDVFEVAVKTHNKVNLGGFEDFLKDMLKNFKPLDCENCEIADICEVKDDVHCSKPMPSAMREMLDDIFNIKKDNEDE